MLKPACSMAAGHTAAVIAASGGSGRLWYPAASPYVTAAGRISVAQDPVTGGF
jgi:subtilase family serine protease